jgi:hypothetical protein
MRCPSAKRSEGSEGKGERERRNPAKVDWLSRLQRFSAQDLDENPAHLAHAGNEILISDDFGIRADDHGFAGD